MMRLWSSFLSCDARDLCQVGPALARNHLAWLAGAVRLFTLWLFLLPVDSWFLRAVSDTYWSSWQDHPDYVAFARLRDEIDRIDDAWSRGRMAEADARESLRVLSEELLRWEEQANPGVGLFTVEEIFVEGRECPPLHDFEGRLGVFEAEDPGGGDFFCEYLVLVF